MKSLNVIFATGDIKLHNQLFDELKSANYEATFTEIDYLEDIKQTVWEKSPDVIYVSDKLDTKTVQDTKGKVDTYFYRHLMELKDHNVVFLVERAFRDPLIQKLVQDGFYQIIPLDHPYYAVTSLPTNLNEVQQIFEEVQVPFAAKVSEPLMATQHKEESFQLEGSAYLPTIQSFERTVDYTRPIVSVFWSPIPNVGVGSFVTALGNTLAKAGRRVLMIELDMEYPKMARRTALTHSERTIKGALLRIQNGEKGLDTFVVNNVLAEQDLKPTYKAARQRVKELPSNLFLLSRNADLIYEEPMEIKNDRLIEKLFYEAKQFGYHNILVDVPSSPHDAYNLLSLLVADERFAVVDDAFTTSGLFKVAMQAYQNLNITAEDFGLIINKVQNGNSVSDIADFYKMTPVASLPYDHDMAAAQLDLKLEYGKAYMQEVRNFAKRYGINPEEAAVSKKKTGFLVFKR